MARKKDRMFVDDTLIELLEAIKDYYGLVNYVQALKVAVALTAAEIAKKMLEDENFKNTMYV